MAVFGEGPYRFWPVPSQLYAVTVRITQIECLADPVVACGFEANASIDQPSQCVRQCCPRRIADSNMVEPRGMRWRGGVTFAFPSVQSDVVVIIACRKECSFMSIALHQIKAEHATIESDGAIKVFNFQVNVSDAHTRINGTRIGREGFQERRHLYKPTIGD